MLLVVCFIRFTVHELRISHHQLQVTRTEYRISKPQSRTGIDTEGTAEPTHANTIPGATVPRYQIYMQKKTKR